MNLGESMASGGAGDEGEVRGQLGLSNAGVVLYWWGKATQ